MNFLHSIVPNNFCSKIVILFICYYKGNTRLNYIKPRLTLLIRDLLKFQAVSCQFDFKSCFLIYADLYFCDLRPPARTHNWRARMTHLSTSQGVPTKRARTISLENSLSNHFRTLLIFNITNILATSLPLPCYVQLYT